jgi:hypothetical protein
MGALRKIVFGLCWALSAPVLPLCAQTLPHGDPMRLFATCTGRLSALLEYQWLVQDPGADATEARRDAMAQLLAAAMPLDGAARAMDLRLQAKVAEAQLLQQALGRNGAWALALAKRQMANCTALLLS